MLIVLVSIALLETRKFTLFIPFMSMYNDYMVDK